MAEEGSPKADPDYGAFTGQGIDPILDDTFKREQYLSSLSDPKLDTGQLVRDIRIPSLFETPEAMARVRGEIAGEVDADYGRRLQGISDTARSEGRLRTGLTSKEEIGAAMRSRQDMTAKLGKFEYESRQAAADRISKRLEIWATGEEQRRGIQEAGTEERKTQAKDLQYKREELTGEVELPRFDVPFSFPEAIKVQEMMTEMGPDAVEALAARFGTTSAEIDAEGGVARFIIRKSGEDPAFAALVRRQFELPGVIGPRPIDPDTGAEVTQGTQSIDLTGVEQQAELIKLKEQDMLFRHKVTEAELTGIWEAYGPQEYTQFVDAFDTKRGDPKFNSDYDFDNNGQVNYFDMLQFEVLVDQGGIPTLQHKKFLEEQSQFKLLMENDWDKFLINLREEITDRGLDRRQARDLTVMTLMANSEIQAAGIEVSHIANLINMMEGPMGETIQGDEFQDLLDYILGRDDDIAKVGDVFGLNPEGIRNVRETTRLINAGNYGHLGDNLEQVFSQVVKSFDQQEPGMQQIWIDDFDLNGDGVVTRDDAVIATLIGS
tara:strand:+ start:1594 stop:3237 length:1644 start_codon:yes stop_codon:yes gene_type:complete